MAMFPMTLGDH